MFDKDRFIEDCRAAAKETQPGLAVKELIARAVSDPREVARAFGEPQAGLVDVLYRGDDINILHVAWAPLMTLLPHDHLMWVAIGIYGGREENVFYRRGENGLIQLRGMQLETRDAALFGATAIHSAANPLDRHDPRLRRRFHRLCDGASRVGPRKPAGAGVRPRSRPAGIRRGQPAVRQPRHGLVAISGWVAAQLAGAARMVLPATFARPRNIDGA